MSSGQPRSAEPYRVASLDAIAAIPIPAGLAWRPIRGVLRVRAFGVAGFGADEAGQDVIEPHTESEDGRGHEELYVVVRGAARFTLDGEEFDAPAGTLVFVGDPRVHRHGVAVEAAEAPDNPGVWYAQALVAAARNDLRSARGWLERASAREPALLDEARRETLLAALTRDLT